MRFKRPNSVKMVSALSSLLISSLTSSRKLSTEKKSFGRFVGSLVPSVRGEDPGRERTPGTRLLRRTIRHVQPRSQGPLSTNGLTEQLWEPAWHVDRLIYSWVNLSSRRLTALFSSRCPSLGACNYPIFLSRRFHRPIYF